MGYQVLTAYGTKEAMVYLETDDPIDLLLTDIVMPGGINGLELAKKAQTLRPDIKIKLTSGFSERIEDAGPYKDLVSNVLHKPYRKIDLAKTVRAALDCRTF